MTTTIGLMGFGRIGRNLFRILESDDRFEVRGISDIADPAALLYLFRYDTLLGRYRGTAALQDGQLVTERAHVPLVAGRDPGDVDWRGLGVDYVVEATGKIRSRAELARHLERGARRVVLCSPPKDKPDLSVIYGINQSALRKEHRIVSNASCTAHAAAPVLSALDGAFGIERAYLSSIHAYTSVARLADVPAGALRMSRAAAENIIPSETSVAELLAETMPKLAGRLHAGALQVPVQNGSLVDITLWLERPATAEAINAAVQQAARGPLARTLEYLVDPIVSSDVAQSTYSSSFDSLATMMLGDRMAKVIAWFDNSWGYSHRVVDLLATMAAQDGKEAA